MVQQCIHLKSWLVCLVSPYGVLHLSFWLSGQRRSVTRKNSAKLIHKLSNDDQRDMGTDMQFEERLNLVERMRNEETNADKKQTVVPTYGDGAFIYFYVILNCTIQENSLVRMGGM